MATFVTVLTPFNVSTVNVELDAVPEAPADGKNYVRGSKKWNEVPEGLDGVASVNEQTGDVEVVGGTNVDVEAAGGIITVSSSFDAGVQSVNKLDGEIDLVGGSNVTVTTSKGEIVIDSTGGLEAGVEALNGMQGDLDIVGGANVTVTSQGGNQLVISASGTGGGEAGVSSLNNLDGDLVVTGGNHISVTTEGSSGLTIDNEWELVGDLPDPDDYNEGDVVLLTDAVKAAVEPSPIDGYPNETKLTDYYPGLNANTDIAPIVEEMWNANIPVLLPAGKLKWSSTVTIRSKKSVYMRGSGGGTTLDITNMDWSGSSYNAMITIQGESFKDMGVIKDDVEQGQLFLRLGSGFDPQPNEVLVIHDPRNYSGGHGRPYFRNGEFWIPRRHYTDSGWADNDTWFGFDPIKAKGYKVSDGCRLYRNSGMTAVTLRDFSIISDTWEGTTTNSGERTVLQLYRCRGFELNNLDVRHGFNSVGIRLSHCLEGNVNNCRVILTHEKSISARYPLTLGACQEVTVTGGRYSGPRTGIEMGSTNSLLISRGVSFIGVHIRGSRWACDTHGANEGISYTGCYINGGIIYAGGSNTYTNCEIRSAGPNGDTYQPTDPDSDWQNMGRSFFYSEEPEDSYLTVTGCQFFASGDMDGTAMIVRHTVGSESSGVNHHSPGVLRFTGNTFQYTRLTGSNLTLFEFRDTASAGNKLDLTDTSLFFTNNTLDVQSDKTMTCRVQTSNVLQGDMKRIVFKDNLLPGTYISILGNNVKNTDLNSNYWEG